MDKNRRVTLWMYLFWHRLTLLFDRRAARSVRRLQKTYGLRDRAEALEFAGRVLAWAAEVEVAGDSVGRFKNGTFEPALLPPINREVWQRMSRRSLWQRFCDLFKRKQ